MIKTSFNLRNINKEDIAKYIEFLSDPEFKVWLDDEVQNISDQVKIENYLTYGFYGQAVESEGNFIGITGLDLIDSKNKVARFFIVLGKKDLWSKGIGTEVTKSVVKHGFEVLKLRKINSDFLQPNEGVKIVHEKVGFKKDGVLRKDSMRNGVWVDRILVSIFSEELIIQKKY